MSPESEAQTRRKRIDPLLKQLGWEIVPFEAGLDRAKLLRHAVTEHPTSSGPSDYVLFVKGKPLGAVEAKRLNVGSEGVLDQANRYSRDIEAGAGLWTGYRFPFLYLSNGQQHWFADVRRDGYVSRQLPGSPKPGDMITITTDPTAPSATSPRSMRRNAGIHSGRLRLGADGAKLLPSTGYFSRLSHADSGISFDISRRMDRKCLNIFGPSSMSMETKTSISTILVYPIYSSFRQ